MSASEKKRITTYVNDEQKKILIEFVGKHADLKSGKFSNNFSVKDAQKLWEEVTAELHKLPGAVKDWKQWRKTWQDMRSAAKAKNSAIRNHMRQTGGGPATSQNLTDNDQNVLSLICSTSLDGHKKIAESDAQFNWEDHSSDILEYECLEEDEETVRTSGQSDVSCKERKESAPEEIVMQDIPVNPDVPQRRKFGTKRTSAALRYDTSIKQTDRLCDISKEDCESRKQFYTMKLELYKQGLELKKRSVIAKEKLCSLLEEYLKK